MPQVMTSFETVPVDCVTPVSIYLRVREKFPYSLLLESGDRRGQAGGWSFICVKPKAELRVTDSIIQVRKLNGELSVDKELTPAKVRSTFEGFLNSFETVGPAAPVPFVTGLFGYLSYDAIEFFEDIKLKQPEDPGRAIPRLLYSPYQYVLAFNHANQEMHIVYHSYSGDPDPGDETERRWLRSLAQSDRVISKTFSLEGERDSNFSDQQYLGVIDSCKKHIYRGDVFQIVPSRRFEQRYTGDDFLVYRALRSINPSPYLFYFDCGEFKLMGSSPEAQLVVKDGEAEIHPIAGTYRRTGDEIHDAEKAQELLADEKENAEHVMLVDLARNDLSIHCNNVRVVAYREIQYYSHVLHLVSKVSGRLRDGRTALSVLGSTFPAGTLSGAPKYKAMELIDRYESGRRYFYGGAIGSIGFDGSCNHAIMIRTFLAKDQTLFCQAGGGVVAYSDPELELQEANNKLMALKKAIELAASWSHN